MKICVYSDVHGNIEALNKLMETDDYKNADLRLFLGDAVAMGPCPNECVKSIFESGDKWFMGNHDSYMAYGLPVEEYPFFRGDKKEHQAYMRSLVEDTYKEKIKALSKFEYFTFGNKKFYFTHYMWDNDILISDELKDNSIKNLNNLFKGVEADYIVFGHEHSPFEVIGNKTSYICVGSLGMKYKGNYVMIDIEGNNVNIQHKQIDYDVKKVKKIMLERDYPRAKRYSEWLN